MCSFIQALISLEGVSAEGISGCVCVQHSAPTPQRPFQSDPTARDNGIFHPSAPLASCSAQEIPNDNSCPSAAMCLSELLRACIAFPSAPSAVMGQGWAALLQPGEAAVQKGKEGISARVLRVTSFSSLNFSDNTTPALQPPLSGNGAWAAVGRALCLSMG